MTDEQIRQNAEMYAEQNKVNFSEDKNFEIYDYDEQKDAYIAGAHSRDEEIEELRKRIDTRDCRISTIARNVAENCDLKAEIEQLRNPWISVKDRLPEDGQQILEAYTLECTAAGNKSINEEVLVSFYRGKFVCDGKEINYGIGKSKSTTHHWMPIPKSPKGE